MNYIYRILHVNWDNLDDRNAWYMIIEIFWAAVVGAVIAFNSAYALRLGASNSDIGLLSSLPSLLAILIAIPAGQFMQSRPQRDTWMAGMIGLHRLGYLLLALAPWLHLFNLSPGVWVVILLTVFTIPVRFFDVSWIPFLGNIIAPERRGSILSARSMVFNGTITLLTFLAGLWLTRISFPLNYQLLYLVGFIGAELSTFYITRLKVPEQTRQVVQPVQKISLVQQWQSLRSALQEYPVFTRMTVNTLLHGLGVWTAGPLYILYYIRSLGAEESWIGLNATISTLFIIIGYPFWRPLLARLGEPRTLKWAIMGAGLFPLLVGFSPSLTPILIASAINGFFTAGINLSHFTTLLKVIPPERGPEFTGIYTTLINIGAFMCPLVGVAIANIVGLVPTLVGCGVLVLLGSSSFWWRPIHLPKPIPLS